MHGIIEQFVSPKWLVLYIFVASTAYVHFRGKVRHKLLLQLTDHSTFLAPYSALMYLFSAVPNRPYLDASAFPDLSKLKENWRTIREEALKLFDDGYVRAAATHNDLAFNSFYKTGWKRFYVKWYNDPLPSAQALCPKTVELVQSLPSINAALFALLPPGARLVSHRDPFAGSLRYHLGLDTPNSPDCQIVVDGEPYYWKDGDGVLFDETYIHYAENKTDKPRLILFCDIERPLRGTVMPKVNHWFKRWITRASETDNVAGDHVGILNRVFTGIYAVRTYTKRLKAWNRQVYYAAKYSLIGFAFYAMFF